MSTLVAGRPRKISSISGWTKIFLCPRTSVPALEHVQTPIQCASGDNGWNMSWSFTAICAEVRISGAIPSLLNTLSWRTKGQPYPYDENSVSVSIIYTWRKFNKPAISLKIPRNLQSAFVAVPIIQYLEQNAKYRTILYNLALLT